MGPVRQALVGAALADQTTHSFQKI